MKVIQSGRQMERRLIIFRRKCTPAVLFWEYTYSGTPGHLILGVLAKFSGVGLYYSRTPVNGSPAPSPRSAAHACCRRESPHGTMRGTCTETYT